MVFYTDFCPYYFDLDKIIESNYIIDPFETIAILKEFSGYYIEKCLFDNPYISIRNLINQYVEEQTDNLEKREVMSSIIKMKIYSKPPLFMAVKAEKNSALTSL